MSYYHNKEIKILQRIKRIKEEIYLIKKMKKLEKKA
jgi:hypothetical protein